MHWATMLMLAGAMVTPAWAQGGAVVGRVQSDRVPVPFATVAVQGSPRGTAADAEGRYRLAVLAPGRYTLVASSVGYASQARTVTVAAGRTDTLDFELAEAAFESEGITVTATMQEQRVSESPVRV
ncbi:MAG TPA: carboxypeptidase-like regulatory domain-containing protein, partial [Rhodothermales bacterium]|nr:carboxypeptidase-like regulatory domain-containing protein [Rhodothermales bacterium]